MEKLNQDARQRIRYYIYEIEMPSEDWQRIIGITAQEHISVDELFSGWMRYSIQHPEELIAWKEAYLKLPQEEKERLNRIRLVRIYPVEEGQTEEEARATAILKETQI